MPTILLYFGIALVIIVGAMLAVPSDESNTPPPSPLEVMRELQNKPVPKQ
jgi:hypothetical protein